MGRVRGSPDPDAAFSHVHRGAFRKESLAVAAGIRGEDMLKLSARLIKAEHVYQPDPGNRAVYERNYQVFRRLYSANALNFKLINA